MKQVFIWDDKSTWLNSDTEIVSYYSHIRGYHLCRPLDVNSYLIVVHEHPNKIPDPLNGGVIYTYTDFHKLKKGRMI
jgi:hypothetical protein